MGSDRGSLANADVVEAVGARRKFSWVPAASLVSCLLLGALFVPPSGWGLEPTLGELQARFDQLNPTASAAEVRVHMGERAWLGEECLDAGAPYTGGTSMPWVPWDSCRNSRPAGLKTGPRKLIVLRWQPQPSPAIRALNELSKVVRSRGLSNYHRFGSKVFSVILESGSGWQVQKHFKGFYSGLRGRAGDRVLAEWRALASKAP